MQRRSVKEALRATFSELRGLGYIPPPLERLRGALLCVSCPRAGTGAQSTADYPQHVPDPVDVVGTVWSAARGEGRSHLPPCSGAYVVAQNLGAFPRTGGKEPQRDLQTKLNLRCNPLHEKVWRVRLYPQPFASMRGEDATNSKKQVGRGAR
jgi:hypothetical protein